MNHLKTLGIILLLVATIVLSGCGNHNHNNDVKKITDLPMKPTYTSYILEDAAHALTNNGKDLVYGTVNGLIYSFNIRTEESTFLYDLNNNIPDLLIGGLAYIEGNQFFYGAAHKAEINRLDISTGISQTITTQIFPDGIDLYKDKIYSVTNNRDNRITVIDLNGNVLDRLSTSVDDFVAIAHTENYLYILSEDGDIYQVNPNTGESHMVVDNSGFQEGDSFGGVEGLDIFDHHFYMTNVDDSKLYRVEVDVRAFE